MSGPDIFFGPEGFADERWRVDRCAVVRLYAPVMKAAEALGIENSELIDRLAEQVGKVTIYRAFLNAVKMFSEGESIYVPDVRDDADIVFLDAIGAVEFQ